MAQIKRKKVSTKAVKGQKKENSLLKSKKFWIILSSAIVGAAIIGVSIWLIVYFCTQSTTKDNPDFFGKSTEYVEIYKDSTENNAVKFNKISYEGLLMHTESEEAKVYDEYVFVFAADLTSFYADATINTGKTTDSADYVSTDLIKQYETLYKQLAYLQYQITKHNENSQTKAKLYIVDTSVADNTGVLTDSRFGGSDENSARVTFFLYSYKELVKFADTDETKSLVGKSISEVTNTCVNNAYFLMNRDFTIEENKKQ